MNYLCRCKILQDYNEGFVDSEDGLTTDLNERRCVELHGCDSLDSGSGNGNGCIGLQQGASYAVILQLMLQRNGAVYEDIDSPCSMYIQQNNIKHQDDILVLLLSSTVNSPCSLSSSTWSSSQGPMTLATETMSKVLVQMEEHEVGKDNDSDELLQLFAEEDEVRRFFGRLDEELEKVNDFYEIKETEFCERGGRHSPSS
ncbi:hypothetical protein Droror1_Dr00007904 [Drosera rotundifolia]